MNEDKLTEAPVFNVSSLPISSNLISTPKPLLPRSTFPLLITLPSLMCLSLLLTLSIYSIFCHINNINPCPQTYITPSPLFISSNKTSTLVTTSFFQGIIIKVLTANTPNLESTSFGFHFLAPYIMPMSYSGALESPFFEETNFCIFLERFKNMCNDCQMLAFERVCHLPYYSEMFSAYCVKSVVEFSGLD